MRIRDAYQFPSKRFQFNFETERTLLKNFQVSEPGEGDAAFLARTLDPALAFLAEARCDGELPSKVASLLLRTRAGVQERDYGIMSYSLERALTGEFEICSARLLASILGGLQRLISLNAGAFERDDYEQPEDAFRDSFLAWRVQAGALIVAMIDLYNRANTTRQIPDEAVFSELDTSQIDRILGAIDFAPL